jgi:hypothetical protein
MRPCLHASVASFIVLTAASTMAAAEIGPDMRVAVRTYDSAAVAGDLLPQAVAETRAILDASGLELTWHDCQVALVRTAAHQCAAPLAANEIAVRIVGGETERSYRGELPLGYSLVDTGTHAGTLATIYIDRVAWLAGEAGVNAAVLLGRAIAHEIGHLLLGSNGHSESGLMRRVWSCESLKRDRPRDWVFAPGDIKAMQQAVRLRAAPQMARLRTGD